MFFSVEEFAESYQYPVIGFEIRRITWANACARIILGQNLNNLDSLLGDNNVEKLLYAFENGDSWRGEITIGSAAAITDLFIYKNKGYITIKPDGYKKGFLLDQMLSDVGQLMKDPLNNLYNAIQDIDDPQKKENAVSVIKHSFYSLVRLSENQIALSETPEAHMGMTLAPIAQFVQDIIASVNETLNDRDITIELAGNLENDRFCRIHPQKLTQIIMLLLAKTARVLSNGSTIDVNIRFDDNICFIEIPISGNPISIYDASSYLTEAGTPMSLLSVENLLLTKILNNFNSIHDSRIFTNVTKDGKNTIVIAINTEIFGMVSEPQTAPSGLRPELIFLSDILDKESYM